MEKDISTKHSPSSDNSSDMIAGALRTEIWQGKLKSAQPLRQDEIAARFGVSKIPVREALYQLKAEGLVTFFRNRGAFVSELSPDEMDEIYTMRVALEVVALQRAIPHLTIADLGRGEAILNELDQEEEIARWSELNWEFHATLYRPANLPHLLDQVRILHFNVSRYLILYLAAMDYETQSQREHREILAACRQGQVELAAGLLQKHLQSASDHLKDFLNARSA